MSMLERTLKRIVIKYAKSKGFLAYPFESSSNRGVPDHIFISPKGDVIFIEFKREGKWFTKLQYFIYNKFLNQKCNIYLVDDVLSGMKVLDNYF